MAKIYTWQFAVRTYELGADKLVKPAAYLNYLQEAATQASAWCGYDYDWYQTNRRSWFARKTTVRYYQPVGYGDTLNLQTWVSDYRRVQSNREYDLRRTDGTPVLRGRTNWVYIDLDTLRPTRAPEDFITNFEPSGEVQPLEVAISAPITPTAPRLFEEARRVQTYEIDSAAHVNNSVYGAWAEDVFSNFCAALGVDEMLHNDGAKLSPLWCEIEYLRAAQVREMVHLNTRLLAYNTEQASFMVEMRAASGDLLATTLLGRRFTGANGEPYLPEAVITKFCQ
ncbi:MAG: hypothetical protein OHK0023_25970 [Anaerolineae bacterium]